MFFKWKHSQQEYYSDIRTSFTVFGKKQTNLSFRISSNSIIFLKWPIKIEYQQEADIFYGKYIDFNNLMFSNKYIFIP